MKKARTLICTFLTLLTLSSPLFCLSSCSPLGTSSPHVVSAEVNSLGELILVYSNGKSENLGSVGASASVNIQAEAADVAAATTKGLSSAVSIAANFTKTVQNNFGGWFPGLSSGGSYKQDYSAFGSGVIYKLDGDEAMIITNYHVIYDSASNSENGVSDDISVFLYGSENSESAIKAEFVGGSPYYDVAILHAKSDLLKRASVSAASISEDALSVGSSAIAIGNPEASGISATLGIVSVDSEYITMNSADGRSTVSARVVRIDTAVNSGNSGGGLYNGNGELIGIVNAKISDSSVENIAFAIPASIAVAVAENIIDNCYGKENERLLRASLGLTLASTESGAVYNEKTGLLEIRESVTVAEISASGIAKDSLKVGDVLLEATVGGKTAALNRRHTLIDLMLYAREGDTVSIKLSRNGKIETVNIPVTSDAIAAY